ncbi:hypothetical protein JMJ35_007346 [Cladonia borealis]|uniref:Uncharacterized protein n=1 Tax=Cladonia borealis TaxID=184061 RepID=A0AA39UZP3_9LECA|nr:hypothetical protein JMJ35_007346 [Cladonia borealis]
MAAARNQSSSTGIDFSNSRRSIPTQAQPPRNPAPSKSPRGVVKQQTIPRLNDPAGYVSLALRLLWIKFKYKAEESSYTSAPTKKIDQPPKDYCFSYGRSWGWYTSEQSSPTRTGLNGTGEEKSDQEGHNHVDELQNRETAYGLGLPQYQYYSTQFGEDYPRYWSNDDLSTTGFETEESISPLEGKSLGLTSVNSFQAGTSSLIWKNVVNVERKSVIYQLPDGQDPEWEHRGWWSKLVRLGYNEVANKSDFTRRPYNRVDTLFLPKRKSFGASGGSTFSTEIVGSGLTSHFVSEGIIVPNGLDLFGREWIRRWKDGPGRNKDWRSSRYLKPMKEGEGAKYQLSSLGRRSYLNLSQATNYYLGITRIPPHIAVPKEMLRQKSTSCHGHSSYLKPKSSWRAMYEMGLNQKIILLPKSRARSKPWITDATDLFDIEEARRPRDGFNAESEVSNAPIDDLLTAMVSTYTETSSPKFKTPNAKSISLNHLLAYESFVDTILGACLRLKRLLRTEPHYEVYDAESLSDGNQKYEVRAYNLRGLSPKVRNYKIRNLKRASTRSSYIGSLEQGGKKWLVFADPRADLVPEPSRDSSPLWSTRDEYERAFPVLEPHKPDNLEETEKEALQDGVVIESYEASFAKALEEELLKRLDTYQTLEVIERLREQLMASFQPCHHDDKLTPMSEKRKESKSPGQAKRLRDRQRLSRQTRRKAKAALRTGATGDSMPQTLGMTSGPPTEAFSENECNYVATSHTIDNQTQEDFERLWSYCVDTTYSPFPKINHHIAKLKANVNAINLILQRRR